MEVYCGGCNSTILKLCIRQGSIVSFMPGPLCYPAAKYQVLLKCVVTWNTDLACSMVDKREISSPYRERNQDPSDVKPVV